MHSHTAAWGFFPIFFFQVYYGGGSFFIFLFTSSFVLMMFQWLVCAGKTIVGCVFVSGQPCPHLNVKSPFVMVT